MDGSLRRRASTVGCLDVLALLAACDSTRSTSPGQLAEGSQISLAGSTSLGVRNINGQVVSQAITTWSIETTLGNGDGATAGERSQIRTTGSLNTRNGEAGSANRSAPLNGASPLPFMWARRGSTLANGKPNEARLRHARTSDGKLHHFLTRFGRDGGPPIQVAHFVDHEVVDVVNYHWARIDDGWIATAATTTFFSLGKVVAQLQSRVSHSDVASVPGDALKATRLVAMTAHMMVAALAPQRLQAQSVPAASHDEGNCGVFEISSPCSEYLQNYAADLAIFYAVAASAAEAAVATGGVLSLPAALLVAAAAARAALDAYQYDQCVNEHSQTASCDALLGDGYYTSGGDAVAGELASYTDTSTGGSLPGWLQATIIAVWDDCNATGASECTYTT